MPDRIGERDLGHVLDHVGHYLGIGVALEDVAALYQLVLEVHPVLDDPVVDNHDFPATVEMGVGIARIGCPMSGPSGVTYPGVGSSGLLSIDQVLKVGDPSGLLDDSDRVSVVESHPGRVISPILEPGQTGHQDIEYLAWAHIADNSAHISSFSSTT
jgi:hypothetical protein